ncbi:MAG: hypothetical protein ACLUES_16080 [Flavonifractor plautii]
MIAFGFDGVHLGQGALLRRVGKAAELGLFLRRSPLIPTRRT